MLLLFTGTHALEHQLVEALEVQDRGAAEPQGLGHLLHAELEQLRFNTPLVHVLVKQINDGRAEGEHVWKYLSLHRVAGERGTHDTHVVLIQQVPLSLIHISEPTRRS